MRAESLLRKILGLDHARVCGVDFDTEGIIIKVAPTTRVPRCSGCGKKVRRVYDQNRGRSWRHLDLAGTKVTLRYDIRRVACKRCGVRIEEVPWAAASSHFTYPFEDMVGYLAQRLPRSHVAELMRISWSTVGDIAVRVIARHGDRDPLDGLTQIGVDEISYRKHHKYLTIVTDHKRGRVVWAAEGKNAETLESFFAQLGLRRCSELEVITLDMSAAYIKAAQACAPNAQLIFDRFHVQRLLHDAIDEVRRELAREATAPEEKAAIKGARWPLHKNPWNLSLSEQRKLSELQRTNKKLYRCYMLKEALLSVLDGKWLFPEQKLDEWLQWASRSKLRPFIRLSRTVRRYKDGILAYIATGLSNARSEGINRKIRAITGRAFGFHSHSSLIAFILLCCSGIDLEPVFNYPFGHH